MLRAMRRHLATFALTLAVLFAATSPAAAQPVPWKPDIRAALDYAKHRHGIITFAVRTPHHVWGYRITRTEPSASVLKAMLLVAYLRHVDVRDRALTNHDRALLVPMIRRSDDRAAGRILNYVGYYGLRAVAKRVGMRHFVTASPWGRSRVEASDQTLFLLNIDRFIPARHRDFAMGLLGSIVPSQRWGIAKVRPHGWSLYFKSGWGAGTGWVDHQVALLRRGTGRVSVAILTHYDGSHAYGKATLQGVAARLLRGLGPDSLVD
jgi:hypothetical protein